MAETTQFSFDLSEVAAALIKQQGLHEGRWLLAVDFQVAAGMMGSDEGEGPKPGMMARITKVHLVRKDDEPPGTPGLVDAAEVNPPPPNKVHPTKK